jgi:hypothetical protein
MNFGKKEIILSAVVAVLLVVAAVAMFRRPANNENFPEGTWWICTKADCKHTFNLSIKEIGKHHQEHYGEPIPCPKCKSPAVRADKCPHCGNVFAAERNLLKCPKCGKDLTAPPPSSRRPPVPLLDDPDAAVRLDDQRRRPVDVELLHTVLHGPPRIDDLERHPGDG